MDNVIRPVFGRKAAPAEPATPPAEAVSYPLRTLGAAGGYRVGLVEDDAGPEGPSLKVVVGPEDSEVVEPVAAMPATDAGRTDAEMVGLAVLRTLEIVGEGAEPDQ